MASNKKPKGKRGEKGFELYIKEDATVIILPYNKEARHAFKKISPADPGLENIYCG